MLDKTKKPQIVLEKTSVVYNQGQSNEVRSLENANLKLYPQEYVIIFGPSGCGKSTLLYTIAGLQKPTSGTVSIDNSEIYSLKKSDMVEFHRRKIGMIFQAFYLIPSLNVVDNVCLPKTASGDSSKDRKIVSETLLKRFGILNQAKKMPSELSGGQKQRVSIARSLANNPDIILADEPVGNLDSVSSHNVMKILQELNEKDKKTIILVTHDPAHLRYGDRVIYIKDGKIIKEEIVKKKISPDDELQKEIEVKEKISPDLKMLMRAFKDLTLSQIGVLMAPFKAQQLLSHILLSMTFEQMDKTTKALEEIFYSRKNFDELAKMLDNSLERGGAGWDKRLAQSFTNEVRQIVSQGRQIDFDNVIESTNKLFTYLSAKFRLGLTPKQKERLRDIINERLKNKYSVEKVILMIDMPIKNGGAGLDKRTAKKISRELEILLLVRYGNKTI
ncbi:MAG: ABC transporter ATP-binding protein [Patescibacteria group bacterium]|nr:ABC transporter ATP-binding protein [Patescibacteria group bacterium]